MKDGPRDPKDGPDKRLEDEVRQGPPPIREDYPLEAPLYEQQFDPFVDPKNPPSVEETPVDRPVDEDDDWSWREPDDYWIEEGMWPWPEPRPRRREDPRLPEDVEPQ